MLLHNYKHSLDIKVIEEYIINVRKLWEFWSVVNEAKKYLSVSKTICKNTHKLETGTVSNHKRSF